MKTCGCKGRRFCLLCRKDLPLTKEIGLNSNKQFFYCNFCVKKAFRQGLENHYSHSENLIEYKDYVKICGIFVCDEVIDSDLENELIKSMDQDRWLCSQSGRRKQDFGPKVNFKKRKLRIGNFCGLPALPMQILEKLIDRNDSIKKRLHDFRVIEICNLEYRKDRGSVIEPHFDDFYLWGNRIVTMNLLSPTKLILSKSNESSESLFDKKSKIDHSHGIEIVINLKRRSLLILGDEARYEWLHEIRREHINERRLAITYRELSEQFLPGGSLFNDQIDQLLTLASNRI